MAERVIQISDHRILTNKGRLFEQLDSYQGQIWIEVELPDFKKDFEKSIPKGKTKFIESETKKEKWENLQLKDL